MILVAGGTGTLGSLVVGRLTGRGLPVRVLTRDLKRAGHLADRVELVEGDARDRETVRQAVNGVSIVVSAIQGLAGSGGVSPASVDRDGNINLIDAAAGEGADFVLMSIVNASPESRMELFRMKHEAEEHLRQSALSWTIVRATLFLETWVNILERTARRSGRPVVFGRGDNPINFVSATDVAALVERAVSDPTLRGASLDIGGPQNLTFNQLAIAIQEKKGWTGTPRHVPRSLLRAMAVVLQPIKSDVARQIRAALVMDTVDLTFKSTDLRQTIGDIPLTKLADVL